LKQKPDTITSDEDDDTQSTFTDDENQ